MPETDVPSEKHQDIPDEHHRQRIGGWMPADHRIHKKWLGDQVEHVDKHPQQLNQTLRELEATVNASSRLRMLATSMYDEVPSKKPYDKDPAGHKQIRDFGHLLSVLNHIMGSGPTFTEHEAKVGIVGVPMNATLDWPMATPSGYALFLDPEFNAAMKKVLNEWGKFLKSPESAKVLSRQKTGWFGETAMGDIQTVANQATGPDSKLRFEDCFKCDPNHDTYGYNSWDAFFTRELAEGYRPTAAPDDDSIIINACESKPFNLQQNIKMHDQFWTKGNKYSLSDMMAKDKLAEQFVGGTIYQAFLSALSYHRWHAPVSGTIKKAYVVDGTFFSEKLSAAIINTNDSEESKLGLTSSQSYIAHMATRALIFMEADNPDIGLMCFVGIGMDEVSTCDITVKEGQHVKKGECTGMFHFGGSSHTLIFRPGVKVEGFPKAGQAANVPVRSKLAVVSK